MLILVTGGAGFIGSNFLNCFVPKFPQHEFINLDKLTYAANLANLVNLVDLPNYSFVRGDLTDFGCLEQVFENNNPDLIINFAAESHVDRSILGPVDFVETNIKGTFNLLEICRKQWSGKDTKLFIQVSTDEVYGSLGREGKFVESNPYDPSSPYSASKAAGDHLGRAYNRTYGLPVIITNCSNNYGPYQFPEKLIPLMVLNAVEGKELPVYGRGDNVRDWLFVEDHCKAIWTVIEKGISGETYNIGGDSEKTNLEVVNDICTILGEELNTEPGQYKKLIKFVEDRPGHDLRYAVDTGKIKRELGWQPEEIFSKGLKKTVRWYLGNSDWVNNITTGQYRGWIEKNYRDRLTS